MSSREGYPQQNYEGITVFGVALVTLILFLWAHHSSFLNPYVINDDVRQQLYWMERWIDPELYPPTLLNEYSRLYVPWGVQALYFFASFFIAPLAFSKLLSGALYVFMGTLVYMSARRAANITSGLAVISIYWFMPFFLHAMSGGLARAFAGPLLMLFLFGWLIGSRKVVAIAIVLQALFIPYIFILCCGATGIAWLLWKLNFLPPPPFLRSAGDLVITSGSLLLLFAWHWQMEGAGFGPLPTYPEMVNKPEFYSAGRFPILPVPSVLHELIIRPWEFITPFRDQGKVAGIIGLLIIIPLAILGAIKENWRQWADHITAFAPIAMSSLFLYFFARIIILQLFIPSRYLEYSVNVGYCFLLGICLHGLLKNYFERSRYYLAAFLIIMFLLGGYRTSGIGLYDYSGNAILFETIQQEIPKDALVAGHPKQMDNVLTFGRRNVFVSYELAHPWNLGYWATIKTRLEDLFTAYYATDLSTVINFCTRNDIEFIIVDRRFFNEKYMSYPDFFEPFSSTIKGYADEDHILLSPTLASKQVDENIFIVDIKNWGCTR